MTANRPESSKPESIYWDEDWLIRYLCQLPSPVLDAIEAAQECNGRFRTSEYSLVPHNLKACDPDRGKWGGYWLTDMGAVARQFLIHRRAEIDEAARDTELDALNAAARYFDEGFTGPGWKPSEIIRARYCIMATRAEADRDPAQLTRAKAFAHRTLAESRKRWKAGLFANPLEEPRRRPAFP